MSLRSPSGPGRFSELIHAPPRLRIRASLALVQWAELSRLRDALDVADAVLRKHLKQLADAGYVSIDKFAKRGRSHTRISLTREGRVACVGHVAALREMLG